MQYLTKPTKKRSVSELNPLLKELKSEVLIPKTENNFDDQPRTGSKFFSHHIFRADSRARTRGIPAENSSRAHNRKPSAGERPQTYQSAPFKH